MTDELPVEELESLAHVEVGEALRRVRRHYDRTLDDVERALRIRACQLDAIERGDLDALPGRVYAIGFVRTYGEYLGLDGAKVVQLFKAQYMDGQSKSDLSFPVPASETKTPAIWLLTLCLFLASFLFALVYQMSEENISHAVAHDVPPVPDELKAHVRSEILSPSFDEERAEYAAMQEPAQEAAPVENMGDEEQKPGIILNIMDDSWVEIKNGEGDIIVSNILEKGDQYFVPDSPGLSMSLGNAANVEIVVDGRALKPLGKEGDVRRDIPLDMSYLKTLEFQEQRPAARSDVEEEP